jgi:hypothetical protein
MRHTFAFAVPTCLYLAALTPVSAEPFYGDPPDETHPWAVHDMNRPQPPKVEPGEAGQPPSDAVVLFDGSPGSLEKWMSDKKQGQPVPWRIVDGALEVVPGSGGIRTKEAFGDCQLRIEWCAPRGVTRGGQGRSNSGVFFTGDAEVQVLDNFDNPTYADGFAGSLYGVNPPHANALRPPGEWQTYDIIFRRPVFKDGKMLDTGRVTVLMNGVVVQDSTPLEGGGGHRGRSRDREFPAAGPLKLQDHGDKVRFRNIWYRPLPKRAVEGGDLGVMDPADAMAMKQATAAKLRQAAQSLQGKERMFKLMESLCYATDDAAVKEIDTSMSQWVATVEKIQANQMEAKKGEIMQGFRALAYLTRFKLYPDSPGNRAKLEKLIREAGWDPR